MSKPSTATLQRIDAAHYLHPFTDTKQLAQKGTRVITRADGVWLEDSDGHRILDGMSGLWCVALGYGRKELAEVAYRQMQELPYYNSFFQCTNPPAIELSQRLAEVTPPQFNRVFLTGSGSEANDTMIRLVRHYWALRGEPERNVLISRWNGYHGSTMGGASLGGMTPMHAQGGLPIPGITHIQQPYAFEHRRDDETPAAFGLRAAGWLAEKIEEIGPRRVAAFVGEPVQGAGGVVIPPDTYWPEIQRICDHYGILLVSDEVICGFGRTGRWFGCETYGSRPDLMPIAKAMSSGYLPIGGLMVSDRVAEVLVEKGGEFAHGYTYSGHPAACAVAAACLDIMRREHVVEGVQERLAPHFARQWATLGNHPLVGEARSVGLLGALELVPDRKVRRFFVKRGDTGTLCRDFCVANGVIARAVRDSMICAPPLTITTAEIDELVRRVGKALDQTQDAIV